ncbi:hypothetical protein DHEL01_v202501 [Diaporthe helianthi]|uniref:C2H2-type domain-containing protein n=1 Tax=Diaporthe helianthi TaxID=158607 RepID=A0A2P5I9E2_DIAHE|nr:hypothetical protein DHEL01_v202501 [Diaporthe helianthi]
MSEYNDFFDFNAPQFGFDTANFEYPALPADTAQSMAWTAPLQPSNGMMGGDTAAQLQLDVNSASKAVAGSLGLHTLLHDHAPLIAKYNCAVCLEPYQTDSALHQHAIEAQHQAYKCKCGTGFNKASALKRHIGTKDAPKTFACTLCYDKFTRKDKLKDHCRHYHKVTDEGLQVLFSSQEVNPRAGAASRHRRRGQAAVPGVAASSAASLASAAHAPAGPAVWKAPASTGRQYTNIPTGPSVLAGPTATTSAFQAADTSSVPGAQFVPSADAFAVDPALDEDFSGLLDYFVRDYNGVTSSGVFSFY